MVLLEAIRQSVAAGRIYWQRHALVRMLERNISRQMVSDCLLNGEVVEEYRGDRPLPSLLVLGFSGAAPLHVVVAGDPADGSCYVITVYRPDEQHFLSDFRTRRIP